MHCILNKNIPVVIEEMLKLREGKYNLRGLLMFSTSTARTNVKIQMCVSVGSAIMEWTQ